MAATLLLLALGWLPNCTAPGQELALRTAFVLCHDAGARGPVWTAYRLDAAHLAAEPAPRPRHFRRDASLAGAAADADYRHSGFARGHLVPAADLAWSAEALRDTFLLSNVAPQDPTLNLGKWRQLENRVRRLAAGSDHVVVITGTVHCGGAPRIGANQVAVPCEFYKVVIAVRDGAVTTLAAILPNAPNPAEPLERFETSIEEVERRTGLTLLRPVR